MKINFLIPLMAGLGLLCACKGKNAASSADTVSQSTNYSKNKSPKSDTLELGTKLVKTADIHFKVKNVEQTSERIATLTTNLNGIVTHQVINSTSGSSQDICKGDDSLIRVTIINTTADMTVKIPPANIETFLNQVQRMGIYINNSKMDITDKSLDYLSTRLKLKNQNELVEQQKNEGTDKKSPDNLLAFKNNIVDQQIDNRRIDDSVKNSVVTLSFYESNIVSKEVIANDDLSAYNLSFGKRLNIAFQNGLDAFIFIIVGIANFWIFIVLGVATWFLFRYYKNKKLLLAKRLPVE